MKVQDFQNPVADGLHFFSITISKHGFMLLERYYVACNRGNKEGSLLIGVRNVNKAG